MAINVSTVSDPRTNVRYYWLCLLIPGVGLILVMLFKRNWSSRCWCNRPKKNRNLPNDINVEHQLLMRPHVDAENSMQQDEQRTVSSFNSPSNQLEDAANMTAHAENGEEIQDQRNMNETNEDSNARELNAEGQTAATINIADKTRIDKERIVEAIVEKTREERDAENGNEIIKRCRDFLEERMDPDSGLLDTLSNETLSWREFLEVRDKSPFCKRNSLLLDYILEKHQYNGLLSALQENEQLHIVNYLNANAERRPDYGEEWPLTANEIKILGANQKSLISLLKLSDLLNPLRSSNVINERQLISISVNPSSCSQNEEMLVILRRRSLRDYHQTIRCLRESNQSHIADVLESGGVIAEVHANLDEPSENVDEVEDEISTRFANTLNGKSIAESIKILERAQLKVIAAQKGGCIVLYIWCVTEKELLRLFDSQTSGRLKDDAEQLFNQLLAHSKQVAVKNITMIDEDCERMKAYFGDHDGQSGITDGFPAVQVFPYTAMRGLFTP